MEKKKLVIPVNVVEQADFIAGFGSKELIISGVTLVISSVIVIVSLLADANLILALAVGAGLLLIVITLIKRDRFDESVIDKLRFVKSYYQAQKQYEYRYFNIYEGGQKYEK